MKMTSKIYTPGDILRIFLLLISSIITIVLPAQGLPVESPVKKGLSADRLIRIHLSEDIKEYFFYRWIIPGMRRYLLSSGSWYIRWLQIEPVSIFSDLNY
jgi:hypothetical protein